MGLFDTPEVTILKESSDAKRYLEELERIKDSVGSNKDAVAKIDKEIAITKAGIVGEDSIMFELMNSGMDLVVLHDLFIESPSGLTAQIDYLVITPYVNVILECKNLIGNIEINNKGDFIRTFEYGGRKYKEGIYSPITQNERHITVYKECRKDTKSFIGKIAFDKWFDLYNKSYVILANSKTIVNDRYAPKAIKEKVYKADQLIGLLKSLKSDSKSSKKEMIALGNRILEMNQENRKDYIEKYKALENEVLTVDKEANDKEETTDKVCPKCGSKLVLRTAKKGAHVGSKFYGCSGYPKCRYIENIG